MKAAALALLLAAGPAGAAGLDAWLSALARAESDFEAACETLRAAEAPAGLVWLQLGPNGVEIAPATPEDAAAAAFWAEAALGAKRAAETLYGQAAGAGLAAQPVMIETGPEGISLHDGAALTTGDACDALRRMVSALGGAAPTSSPFEAARDEAGETVSLPRGGAAVAPLAKAPPDGAVARGPDGVLAEIELDGEGAAFVALEAGADAELGETTLRIYTPDDPFRAVAEIPLLILPGEGGETGDVAGALSPGETAEGALALGAEARLTVEVTEPGRIAFASEGATDLAARLETADGAAVAADDDSGADYGFSLGADLRPGRYVLILTHCCGGGGRYHVTATRE